MSGDLTENLSRFTPNGSGLDRDAILFAAGQASARPHRKWQAIAAALLLTQSLTLVLLWPSSATEPALSSRSLRMEEPSLFKEMDSDPYPPFTLRKLYRDLNQGKGLPSRALPEEEMIPDAPPLRPIAFSTSEMTH